MSAFERTLNSSSYRIWRPAPIRTRYPIRIVPSQRTIEDFGLISTTFENYKALITGLFFASLPTVTVVAVFRRQVSPPLPSSRYRHIPAISLSADCRQIEPQLSRAVVVFVVGEHGGQNGHFVPFFVCPVFFCSSNNPE